MKRPIVIEFSGLPNSGKTTLLFNLKEFFKDSKIKTLIVWETAEILPSVIPSGSIAQNLWITLETIQKNLELKYVEDFDLILLDRGLYNQLYWSTLYTENESYSLFTRGIINTFSGMYDMWPDYLYVIDVDVEESLKRRMLNEKSVTFSKKEFLTNYKKTFKKFYEKIENVLYIDTTHLSKDEVALEVYSKIKQIIKDEVL
mgnify:CR=1 FL=1